MLLRRAGVTASAGLSCLPARRYASAGNSDRNVSVRLSRAGIVSKRRKLAS